MGKHLTYNRNKLKLFIVLSLVLILFSVGITVAYIIAKSAKLSNEFIPANVACSVDESFSNGIKQDVSIKNTGNVNAYIRAAIIVNWVTEDGKILSVSPTHDDYSIVLAEDGWFKGSDGFWYYKTPVAPGNKTLNLINSATQKSAPEGCRLNIQILASAIQAEPIDVVKQEWGVKTNGTELIQK